MVTDWFGHFPNPFLCPENKRLTPFRHHQTGRVAEQMGNTEHALSAYENALRHNPDSLPGLIQVAGIARIKEDYQKVGHDPLGPMIPCRSFSWSLCNRSPPRQSITSNVRLSCSATMVKCGAPSVCPFSPLDKVPIHQWFTCHTGHCYLMRDELQRAYSAYQQALYLLPSPKV